MAPSISDSAALQYHTPLWNTIPSRPSWQREMGNVFWASSSIFILPLFLIFYRGSKWIIFILTCKCLGCALGWDLSIDYISERYGSSSISILHMEVAVLFKKKKEVKVTVILYALKNKKNLIKTFPHALLNTIFTCSHWSAQRQTNIVCSSMSYCCTLICPFDMSKLSMGVKGTWIILPSQIMPQNMNI